ncbi:hypothetical protein E1A91_D12G185100v1, partial [Gossypium mustelinum]
HKSPTPLKVSSLVTQSCFLIPILLSSILHAFSFWGMRGLRMIMWTILLVLAILHRASSHGIQPLSRIAIHKATLALDNLAYVKASPTVLGLNGQNTEWVTVEYSSPNPSMDDWIVVFSPANFSASTCPAENPRVYPPLLCSAPIKFQYANYTSPDYKVNGKGPLKLQLINQRSDFSFALFSNGFLNPKLVAVSNTVSFANPNAPVYPRLAQGKQWDEVNGYGIDEAEPFVQWGPKGGHQQHSPAVTLTFERSSVYTYKLGHRLFNSTHVWSQEYQFRASPFPGQNSLQRVVIFGDMGKDEADGSNEYNNFQRGSLNTTKQLIKDLKNIDIVFHIGDICYANGYISQWDQFTAQIEPIASAVPYMLASGNHERDWPGTGSFYENNDSGGECGVLAETMFFVPAENRAKYWYSTDYGMFRFCIADSEHDWREGTEQYKFIEHCLASVDRQKQPWLVFLAHRVLGYSSDLSYAVEGSFGEPMAKENLQKLWQTCPIYENQCTDNEKRYYKGTLKGTIHVVAGGAGASLSPFTTLKTKWSLFKDYDYGFIKLTAFDHSNLLFEYKKSSDGKVYDSFRISRDYRDILACTVDSCPLTTLAS